MKQYRDELLDQFRETLPEKFEAMWDSLELDDMEDPRLRELGVRIYVLSAVREIANDERDPNRIEYGLVKMPVALEVFEEWLQKKMKGCEE